jgi:hypothetical protein
MRTQLEQVYGEVFRVLKPGALFASYEWVATKDFDGANPEHVRIIDEINYGNGLPVGAPSYLPSPCIALLRSSPYYSVKPLAGACWICSSALSAALALMKQSLVDEHLGTGLPEDT